MKSSLLSLGVALGFVVLLASEGAHAYDQTGTVTIDFRSVSRIVDDPSYASVAIYGIAALTFDHYALYSNTRAVFQNGSNASVAPLAFQRSIDYLGCILKAKAAMQNKTAFTIRGDVQYGLYLYSTTTTANFRMTKIIDCR